MYIVWKFNKEAAKISLEDFERDFESFFGFMMLKLGDYQLGFADKRYPADEGDEDISYYINSLIKCGITLLLGQEYKVKLLTSNLLEIHVRYYNKVNITIVNVGNDEMLCSYDISFKELTDEIKSNYNKYINNIQEINSLLLKSKTVLLTLMYYEIFIKLLDFNNR